MLIYDHVSITYKKERVEKMKNLLSSNIMANIISDGDPADDIQFLFEGERSNNCNNNQEKPLIRKVLEGLNEEVKNLYRSGKL